MKVVNYNQAATIAGVSRQRINTMRNAHKNNKKSFPFFVFDPLTANPGVDIEHVEWLSYVGKTSRKVKRIPGIIEKHPATITESKSNQGELDNNDYSKVRFDNLLQATYFVIVETYKPTDKQVKKLMGDISKRFEGMGK